MSGGFGPEIAAVTAAALRVGSGHAKGVYALPWYLVVGEPGSGRSTALRAMNLSWPEGEGPFRLSVAQPLCTYWVSGEAVFIEPEGFVLGPAVPNRNALAALCDALRSARSRELVDGVLLVISVVEFIDLDERGVEAFANRLRGYLVDVGRRLHADVPVYIAVTRYDTLWGFAEVFQWTPERRREEPWGFLLPGDTQSQQTVAKINEELDGLGARFESFCLAKLSSEDPPEHRTRALQHLAEVRELMTKLRALLGVIAMANAFERAPWIRALGIGAAVPGAGDRLRVSAARFANMGLSHPPQTPPARPGGLPMFAFLKTVVLPERELVPLRVRWRDDKVIVIGFILGLVLAFAAVATAIAFAISR